MERLLYILMIVLVVVLSYCVTALLVGGICWCFGFHFSFKIALGVWLMLVLINATVQDIKTKKNY